jgi:uncharacterized protein (TIGR03435 family)
MRVAVLLLMTIAVAGSQAGDRPEFEVASIRATNSPADSHGQMGPTADSFNGVNMPLKQYIVWAYKIRDKRMSGPDWLDTTRFTLSAKAESAVPIETMRLMMRKLLEDRFHLIAHEETRTLSASVLTVAKTGPRHLNGAAPESQASIMPGMVKPDGNQIWLLRGVTPFEFAFFLERLSKMDDVLVDGTGLAGKFDIDLNIPVKAVEMTPLDYGLTVVFPAVSDQLGLKVEVRKVPSEVLVIDHVDRVPTEN